jgi:hypothetical protein
MREVRKESAQMERTPPPVELWEQIPLHVQAVSLQSCVVLGRCLGIL